MSTHPSALALERLAAKEAMDAETRRHVDGCAECRAKLSLLERSTADYRASPQAQALRETLGRREAARAPRRWVAALAGAAVAAGLAVVLWPRTEPIELLAKGDGVVFVSEQQGERWPWTGAPFRKGDVLQPVWNGAATKHVVLLAVAPDGAVQVVVPTGGATSEVVGPGNRPLGPSITIDAASHGHVLWVFESASPFSVADAKARAERGDAEGFSGSLRRLPLLVIRSE